MNKTTKILIVMAILLFAVSPSIAERAKTDQLFTLGNAERTYDYQGTTITCYLGQLFPGQPIRWCMYPDGSMDHSWFIYQTKEMNDYYTGSGTTTYTFSGKQK